MTKPCPFSRDRLPGGLRELGPAPIGAGGDGAQPAASLPGGGTTYAPAQPYDVTPLLHPKAKYFGATFDGVPKDLSPVERYASQVGRTPAMLEYYLGWGDEPQAGQTRAVWEKGRLPYIAWEPHKATFAQIADGSQDAYIVSTARTLRALNVPVAMSLAHEMNGAWYPWGTRKATAAQFVRAGRHVHDVFQDEGVSTVIWYEDWLSFFFIDCKTHDGRHLPGIPGYRAAVRDGYFDGVMLDCSGGLPAAEEAVRQEMRTSGRYRLTSSLPYRTSTGTGHFEIWVRRGAGLR
ncbi:glycosyl hydrolase [Streptomyces sp. NPDC007905]|uniref:glycosyl hydrolase n=1 Tax=Streptomyces sp. NPDC007905 TaxID=3364788 RepID=UPI0036E3472E